MRVGRCFCMVAMLGMMTAPGLAQTLIDGGDTGAVVEVARGYGSAAMELQANGNPGINGRIDGIGYRVRFVNCREGKCGHLNFRTAFSGVQPSLEEVDAWNREKRFGRAYLDAEGDAAIEMDVVVEFGLTRANVDANFAVWRLVLTQFAEYLTGSESGSEQP